MKKALLSSLEYNKVLKNLESNSHAVRNKQKHCHGISRKEAKTEAEAMATDEHGKTRKEE
jgi:hypothetical protein